MTFRAPAFCTKRSYTPLVAGKGNMLHIAARFHFEHRPLKTVELRDRFSRRLATSLAIRFLLENVTLCQFVALPFLTRVFFSKAPRDFLGYARTRPSLASTGVSSILMILIKRSVRKEREIETETHFSARRHRLIAPAATCSSNASRLYFV